MYSKKKDFAKNLTFLYSNKIYTFIISIIYTYFIANYLGPEKYGIVNLYINYMLVIFGLFGILTIQEMLNRFTPRYKSMKLFKKSLYLEYIMIIPVFIIIIIFAKEIIGHLKAQDITLLKYAALILIVYPLNDSFIQLFQGLKRFGKTLKISLISNTLNLVISIILVIYLGYDIYGVIIAKIIAAIAAITIFFFYIKELKFENQKIDINKIKKYASGAIPQNIFKALSNQVLLIYIGIFIGAKELGLYYLAQKLSSWILNTPVTSIRDVLLPYCIEESKDKNALERHTSLTAKLSFLITVALSIILIIASRVLIPIIFPEYIESSSLIILFSIIHIIGSYSCLRVTLISINRMDILAKIDFIGLTCSAVFGIIFIPKMGVNGILITQILTYFLLNSSLYYALTLHKFKISIIPTKNDIIHIIKSAKNLLYPK